MFYQSTVEAIMSFCILCWYGNSSSNDRRKLKRISQVPFVRKYCSYLIEYVLHSLSTAQVVEDKPKGLVQCDGRLGTAELVVYRTGVQAQNTQIDLAQETL